MNAEVPELDLFACFNELGTEPQPDESVMTEVVESGNSVTLRVSDNINATSSHRLSRKEKHNQDLIKEIEG